MFKRSFCSDKREPEYSLLNLFTKVFKAKLSIGGRLEVGSVSVDNSLTNSSSKIRIGTTTFGNSADPATSVTGINSATASKEIVTCQWYIKDAITIDQVRFWSVTDEASSANTVNFHIYSYDCDAGNDSDGGDLTGGSLHANGTTETRIGYITNGTLTIDDGDVAAGKSIFCFFENEDGTDDTTIQMTIHYHLT